MGFDRVTHRLEDRISLRGLTAKALGVCVRFRRATISLVRYSRWPSHWLVLLTGLGLSSRAEADRNRCSSEGKYVVVDTSRRSLHLCAGTAAVEEFPVSLGRGGTGGHAHGANRTPVGAFTLASPRRSQKFGAFISFLGAWGIHGPARSFTWAGSLNTTVDWTRGCIATGSDEEIERIAAWIRKEKVRRILIGPDGKPPGRKSPAAQKRPIAGSAKNE